MKILSPNHISIVVSGENGDTVNSDKSSWVIIIGLVFVINIVLENSPSRLLSRRVTVINPPPLGGIGGTGLLRTSTLKILFSTVILLFLPGARALTT